MYIKQAVKGASNMKKWIIPMVIVLLIAGYFGYSSFFGSDEDEVISYTSTRVDYRDLSVMVSGAGTVGVTDEVSIKAKANGEVSVVNFEELDYVVAGYELLKFNPDSLESQILQTQLDIADAERKLSLMLSPDEGAVQSSSLKLKQAEDNLALRLADLEKLSVEAPVSGIVSDIGVKIGDDVSTSSLLMKITNPDSMVVTVPVLEEEITNVSIGMDVSVLVLTLAQYGQGTVVDISDTTRLDGRARVYDVTVALSSLPEGTRSGMSIEIGIPRADDTKYYARGNAIYSEQILVKPRISGTVDEILVKEGDIVKAGDLLVKLKSDTLDSQIESARLDVEQAQLNLDNLLSVSAEDIAIQKQRIELLKLKLDGLYKDLNNLTVTAPIEGTVTYKGVNEGNWVNNGTLLATITNQEQMQVVVDVDELDIIRVEEGQRAKVYIDAVSDRVYEGTVVSIGRAGRVKDGMSTFAVTILLDDNEFLRPGMTAYAEIILEGRENVLVVPSSAVFERNNKTMVRILVDGEPVSIEVEVGMRTDGLVEIVSGLNPGDRVITSSYQESSSTSSPSMFTLPGGGK